jgi:hypothetical protein
VRPSWTCFGLKDKALGDLSNPWKEGVSLWGTTLGSRIVEKVTGKHFIFTATVATPDVLLPEQQNCVPFGKIRAGICTGDSRRGVWLRCSGAYGEARISTTGAAPEERAGLGRVVTQS